MNQKRKEWIFRMNGEEKEFDLKKHRNMNVLKSGRKSITKYLSYGMLVAILCGSSFFHQPDQERTILNHLNSENSFQVELVSDIFASELEKKTTSSSSKDKTINFSTGEVYKGTVKNGKMDGKGTLTYPDGNKISGSFKENKLKEGIMTIDTPAGSYSVNYSSSKPKSAEITFIDGTTYEGDFADFKISGTGKLKYPNKDSYEGDFSEGVRSGEGTYTWSNGDTYNGFWKSDQMSGQGKYTFKNQSVLEGTFDGNHFISGKVTFKSGQNSYDLTIKDQAITEVDLKHGDGFTYKGAISNGLPNGEGTIKYSNGETYKGTFKDGLPNGKGKYSWTNSVSISGTFKNGFPDGECIYQDPKTGYVTQWSNGICTAVTSKKE